MSQVQYGAVAAKVRAMYGNRLKREDYQRLAGMQNVSEVAAHLKTYPAYSDALAVLGPQEAKRRQVEEALSNDMMGEFFRILSFIGRQDADIMRSLVVKAELREIMRFMRLAEAGRAGEYTFSLPQYFNRYSKIRYNMLSTAVTYADMLEAVNETPYYPVLQQLEIRASGFPDYTSVEIAIQSSFYRWAFSTIDRHYTGPVRDSLRKTIGIQVDMMNITAIMRLKRSFPKALENDNVYKYLIPASYRLKPALTKQLLGAADEEAMLSVLRSSTMEKLFPTGQSHEEIDRYYYNAMIPVYQRLLRNGSPDVSTPLAYLFLKELEIRNLTSLIECVRYNVPIEKTMSYMYF